jgi:hypothetical protein
MRNDWEFIQVVFSLCKQVATKPGSVQVFASVGDEGMPVSFWRRCIRIASVIGGACYIQRRLGRALVVLQRRRSTRDNWQKELNLIAWFILWC